MSDSGRVGDEAKAFRVKEGQNFGNFLYYTFSF